MHWVYNAGNKYKVGVFVIFQYHSISSISSSAVSMVFLWYFDIILYHLYHFQLKMTYLSNKPYFRGGYRRNNPTWDVGRTREKLVNHEPSGEWFTSFSSCFYALTIKNVYERQRNWFLISRSSCLFSTHSSDVALSQSQLLIEWNGNSVSHKIHKLEFWRL